VIHIERRNIQRIKRCALAHVFVIPVTHVVRKFRERDKLPRSWVIYSLIQKSKLCGTEIFEIVWGYSELGSHSDGVENAFYGLVFSKELMRRLDT
jgi:hypothetical protein